MFEQCNKYERQFYLQIHRITVILLCLIAFHSLFTLAVVVLKMLFTSSRTLSCFETKLFSLLLYVRLLFFAFNLCVLTIRTSLLKFIVGYFDGTLTFQRLPNKVKP